MIRRTPRATPSAVPGEAPSFVFPLRGRHLRVVVLVGREEVRYQRAAVLITPTAAPVGDCQPADHHLGHESKYSPGGSLGKVEIHRTVFSAVVDVRRSALLSRSPSQLLNLALSHALVRAF